MEELFYNFADHVGKMINPKLGNDIKIFLRKNINANTSTDEYTAIECEVKRIMTNYFKNANQKEYFEIATNLFNAYVENDDENLIRSIKYFIRIYSYFQTILLKKRFFKWRILSITKQKKKNNNSFSVSSSKTTVYDKLYQDAKKKQLK